MTAPGAEEGAEPPGVRPSADGERKHHGYTSGGPQKDAPPEPTYAERARTLLVQSGDGTLATLSRRHPGFPFASLMPYALDPAGRPIVLVSALAIHTQNLRSDDRASLLVAEAGVEGRNPLGLGRVTLIGRMHDLSAEGRASPGREGSPGDGQKEAAVKTGNTDPPAREMQVWEEVREIYLGRHPEARYWVDYPDFGFRRMEVEDVYYVGGFGVMGWVSGQDYGQAEPDPLWEAAGSIIDHMNEDHADALVLLARSEGIEGVEAAHMTAVDRWGYHLRVRTEQGMRGLRIGFPAEARAPMRVRELLVAQVREARARLAAG